MQNNTCTSGNIHLIDIPKKYHKIISQKLTQELENASKVLRYNKQVDILIMPAQQYEYNKKLGLFAHAYGTSYIQFKINFTRKDLKEIIEIELPITLHHELSHIVREASVGYGNTLLEQMISEGIGCYVEQVAMPERKIPYIQKIKNEKELFDKAKPLFSKKNFNYHEWFFGAGELPNWAGYRLGYLIVKNFMEKNAVPLHKLPRMNAKDIVKGSDLTVI